MGLNYLEITKWLEDSHQQAVIAKITKLVQVNQPVIEEQDVIDIRKFLSEFRQRLIDNKTDKTLIRMINDNLQAFGPNTIGSNLLLNRFMTKDESLLHRIEILLNQ